MDLATHTFDDLAAIIRDESGIVLGKEKSYLVRHRLEPMIRAESLDGFDSLVKRLHMKSSPSLRNAVIDAITVKETRFFRDQSCFDAILEKVLPACVDSLENPLRTRRRIRIWSAAAATGQEAYSLAMLIHEFAATPSNNTDPAHFSILATDISAAAIETAKAGRYSPAEIHRGLSDARISRHCHFKASFWHINEPIRRLVRFQTFNLLNPPADLGPFDLILCRNVLIYFDFATRRKICRALFSSLQPGGWLILGSAESLYGTEERFENIILGRAILYRKPHH